MSLTLLYNTFSEKGSIDNDGTLVAILPVGTPIELGRQMAASPDLLLALERVMVYLSIHDSQYWTSNADALKAKKIICKAKGEA